MSTLKFPRPASEQDCVATIAEAVDPELLALPPDELPKRILDTLHKLRHDLAPIVAGGDSLVVCVRDHLHQLTMTRRRMGKVLQRPEFEHYRGMLLDGIVADLVRQIDVAKESERKLEARMTAAQALWEDAQLIAGELYAETVEKERLHQVLEGITADPLAYFRRRFPDAEITFAPFHPEAA